MTTTKAKITLSHGNCKIHVDTIIRHYVVRQIFEHLLHTIFFEEEEL